MVREIAKGLSLNHPSVTQYLKVGESALARNDPRLRQGTDPASGDAVARPNVRI